MYFQEELCIGKEDVVPLVFKIPTSLNYKILET